MNFRDCTPDLIKLSGKKLNFRVKALGTLSDAIVEDDLCPTIYKVLIEANKLVTTNSDLYDDAMEELLGEEE